MTVTRRDQIALGLDLLAVLVFAAVGRRSHGEDVSGLLVTFWPFAVGVVIGHVLATVLGRVADSQVGGAVVVVLTVVAGMTLRVVTGAGTAVTFVLVATAVLAVLLLGWRAVARWVRSRSGAARSRS